jgi:hypothetical protein
MELNWPQFRNQSHIRILNENEQVRQYHFYLDSLANERIRQNKGSKKSSRVVVTGFLLQENLSLIQQENGSGIYIT